MKTKPCIGMNTTPCLIRETCLHYLEFRAKYANRDNIPAEWIKPKFDPLKGCVDHLEAPEKESSPPI